MEGDFRVLAELLAAATPAPDEAALVDEDRPSEQLGLF
jgi:hypothetical protein